MRAFGDAFFFIALFNRHDQDHAAVKRWAADHDEEIVTTQWVLTEVADAFSSSTVRSRVRDHFRRLAEDPIVKIIEVSPQQFERALDLYHRRADKEWSLTDCISFNVMRDEELLEALTRDHHFGQAGFIPIFAR